MDGAEGGEQAEEEADAGRVSGLERGAQVDGEGGDDGLGDLDAAVAVQQAERGGEEGRVGRERDGAAEVGGKGREGRGKA